MRKSSVSLEPDAAHGHQALLTLRRGVSALGTWAFDACDAGITITLGAGASCDWQIASPGIAPLLLAFTGDSLLVRALKHDDRVRHNGRILSEGWVRLEHGDMVDLGPSKNRRGLGAWPALQGQSSRRAKPTRRT
ncbi:MAG: FHA domain-containing protein [Myxococcales bacterium]